MDDLPVRLAKAAQDICGSPLEEVAPMAALLHEAAMALGFKGFGPAVDPTGHASTSPGPVNCLLRLTMQRPNEAQPTKCARCGAVNREGCIFFQADGSKK